MERRNEDLVAAFARVLRSRRKQAELSQEELAFRAELSVSCISLLETRNRQPTLTVMAALADELGLSLIGLAELIEAELAGGGAWAGLIAQEWRLIRWTGIPLGIISH